MRTSIEMDRRSFLYGTAAAAGAMLLAGCSDSGEEADGPEPAGDAGKSNGVGSASEPLPVPAEFHEAPMLAERVESGELPPVEERLPTHPYVIPHRWTTTGNYGGVLQLVVPTTDDTQITQYMLGHSPLRWLNDGKDIGPGLVESWETNDDVSEWTLHFREGLKWSDGEPWTTEDIMFWWEDLVLNEEYPEGIPDEARSSAGNVAKVTAPDDTTLVLTYDAPSPLIPEIITTYAKRAHAATWMQPKHYMQQFHPAYNPDVPNDWVEEFDQKGIWTLNPETPTMTGWRLTSYNEGNASGWERNPYYWVVDPDGNQLPYIDEITFRASADVETRKLQIETGEYDFVTGREVGLTLADVQGLRETESQHDMAVDFWDSASGSGSVFFFSQDYEDDKMRELIREPKFRQALSLAYDRAEVRKSVYFDTGELTTGTHGPKTREFHRGDGQQMYEEWRDAWVDYDPERAQAMLDEVGVQDGNGDGLREMPDGSELVIRLDYPADIDPNGEHMKKNELLRRNWEDIGIKTELSPVPPTSIGDEWEQGRLMSTTAWDVATVALASNMQWFMPMEPARWAPLQGQYYALLGTPAAETQQDLDPYERTPPRMEPESGGPIDRLWKLADQVRVEPDEMRRDALIWDMVKIHVEDGPFYMGVVAGYPRVILIRNGLRNVPTGDQTALGGLVDPWQFPTPGSYDPEGWYWDEPEAHS